MRANPDNWKIFSTHRHHAPLCTAFGSGPTTLNLLPTGLHTMCPSLLYS